MEALSWACFSFSASKHRFPRPSHVLESTSSGVKGSLAFNYLPRKSRKGSSQLLVPQVGSLLDTSSCVSWPGQHQRGIQIPERGVPTLQLPQLSEVFSLPKGCSYRWRRPSCACGCHRTLTSGWFWALLETCVHTEEGASNCGDSGQTAP